MKAPFCGVCDRVDGKVVFDVCPDCHGCEAHCECLDVVAIDDLAPARAEVRGLAPAVKAINGDYVVAHRCAAGPADPSCCATCGEKLACPGCGTTGPHSPPDPYGDCASSTPFSGARS